MQVLVVRHIVAMPTMVTFRPLVMVLAPCGPWPDSFMSGLHSHCPREGEWREEGHHTIILLLHEYMQKQLVILVTK